MFLNFNVFYLRHFGLTFKFFTTLKTKVQKSPNECPLIILGNFNIDILNDINHKNNKQQLIEFMNCKSKSQFKNNKNKISLFLQQTWKKNWKFLFQM
jgi:hypothetical protein